MVVRYRNDVTAGGFIALIFLASTLMDPVPAGLFAGLLVTATVLSALLPLGAIGAVVLTLPFFYQPLTVGSSEFASSELLLFTLVAGAAIRQLVITIRMPSAGYAWFAAAIGRVIRSPLFLTLLTLTLAGAFLLNFLFDPDAFDASLREWRWTLLEPLLFLGLLLAYVRMTAERYVTAGFFLASGLLLAVLGLADLVTGGGITGDSITRISGPYPHPNAFSLYLIRPLAMAMALVAFSRSTHKVAWTMLAVGVLALVGAFSRSAFLTVLLVAVAITWRQERQIRLAVAGAMAIAVLAVTVLASDRMLSALSGGSLSLRLEIWRAGLQMIRDRPVEGYGPDQFFYAYTPRYISPVGWGERFTAHAHNLIIDFWVRIGIIGAVFAVSAVLISLKSAIGQTIQGRSRDALAAAAMIALGAAIVQGLIDNGYFVQDLAMSAWLLAFLAFDRPTGDLSAVDEGS